jgi:hypothetical protein
VGPLLVVVRGELFEQCLELGEGGGLGVLGGEPFLEGLLESLGFALGPGLTGHSKIILWITRLAGAC